MLKTLLVHLSPTGISAPDVHIAFQDLSTLARETQQYDRVSVNVAAHVATFKEFIDDRLAQRVREADKKNAALEGRFESESAGLNVRVDKLEVCSGCDDMTSGLMRIHALDRLC